MKLEVGKKYFTRSGLLVDITSRDLGQRGYPFNGETATDKYLSWTEDGRYLLPHTNHEFDLVKEVVEPAAQKEEVVEKVVNKPLFEVGKEYPRRDGRPARILSYHENQERPYFVEVQQLDGSWSVHSLLKTGYAYQDCRESNLNLVPPEPEIVISKHVYTTWLDTYGAKGVCDSMGALKAAIKAYLAEQKEVGKGNIV